MSESHVGLWSPPSHDRRSALELVAELAESSTEDQLRRATQCFFFDYFVWMSPPTMSRTLRRGHSRHTSIRWTPPRAVAKEDTLAVLADSPAARHIPRWTDLRPLRMSDLADRFIFPSGRATYQVLFRPFGYRYQMLIPIK